MTGMESVALALGAILERHGDQQAAAGEAGDQPLTDWPELVKVIAAAVPDVPEAALTDLGAAVAEWSAGMYQVGRARAAGTSTYEDGRRVGAAEADARQHRQRWTLALLAACGEQDQAGGPPEALRDLDL